MTQASSTQERTSKTSTPTTVQPAQVHPAFAWQRSEYIPSLNITIEEYTHKVTGAAHYHLASDNPENVFLVAFRTVPMDSTGVAHILEHTALCGSKRFPVRDPFFMMIRRSLNTFMNAFTSSDWTAYPFASKNRKDFNNLLSVYLDAAFYSRLDPLDFAQEGHRLEFAKGDDPTTELQYKGVVFNEMKGAMSSTNSVLWQTLSKYLFPSTTYHYNSGGEPDHIPDLSYDQLVHFYKTHYHPSNAVFMTFGDIPAIELHEQFEELALSGFDKLDINIAVQDEKRYLAPVRIEEHYAVDESEGDKTHVVVGWLLGRSTDLSDLFKAQLLSSVLLDNSASPLLRALETTELGSAPSPMCGLEDSNREMTFMAGLEGCHSDATARVEELVLDTLAEIAENGIEQEQVEAALHQLELNQREISGDSYPYGLQLILTGLSTALHRGDPIKLLNMDPVLEELRELIKDKSFIPGLIRELLLENPHRVTVTLQPDTEIAARKVAAEKQKLLAIQKQLNEQEKEQLVARAAALSDRQTKEDDPSLLPKVGLEDVPATISVPERLETKLGNSQLPVSFYGQGTNGLSYQQVIFPLPELDEELLAILPLYTSCLPEFGVGDKDYSEVQTWQAQISGGLNCFTSIRSTVNDVQQSQSVLSFSSKALARNHGALTDLIHETIHNVRFDEPQRLKEIVDQICARKESSITGQGHSLAMSLASSKMSPVANLSHRYAGLQGIKYLKALREELSSVEARDRLLADFARLHKEILALSPQFLIIGEPGSDKELLEDINQRWSGNNVESHSHLVLPPIHAQTREAWTTATQVNFCAKAYATVPSGHEDNAKLHVLAAYLRNGFLHQAIRERGGAYGGGAGQDANSASFRFFSYRDPRLQETLDDFDKAIDWVLNGNQPDHQLEEAILSVIGTMDKSTSPAGEAKQAFYNELFGRTLEQRMAFRRQVLATSRDDLRQVAAQYLQPEQASIGIISNKSALEGLETLGVVSVVL